VEVRRAVLDDVSTAAEADRQQSRRQVLRTEEPEDRGPATPEIAK